MGCGGHELLPPHLHPDGAWTELAIMWAFSGGSSSVMEAVRQSLTAVPADASAESNQRSLGNFGVLIANPGGKNKSEERNNAKRTYTAFAVAHK